MKTENQEEQELTTAFIKFIDEVKTNTASKRDNEKIVPKTPQYSEKAKTLDDLITKSKFGGCKEENIRKIISILIDEKIPPKKVKNKITKKIKIFKYILYC